MNDLQPVPGHHVQFAEQSIGAGAAQARLECSCGRVFAVVDLNLQVWVVDVRQDVRARLFALGRQLAVNHLAEERHATLETRPQEQAPTQAALCAPAEVQTTNPS